jgi:tartrate dehydrogenase/decarboxylase/D-malate dehydrogenase
VLESLQQHLGDIKFNIETFDWGSDYYRRPRHHDAARRAGEAESVRRDFLAPSVRPTFLPHITLWGLRLPICQGFDQYANVRPTKILPGITSPLRNVGIGDLGWVIVRENSEGEYAGSGGRVHGGLPEEAGSCDFHPRRPRACAMRSS